MTQSRFAHHRGAFVCPFVRPFVRLSVGLVSGILVSLFSGSATLQASLVWDADPANYGYLWQYSVAPPIGAEACGPTATTNAFTLLQNTHSSHLGSVLTGNDYDSWRATAETLASGQYMKTGGTDKPKPKQGTSYLNLAKGMQQYAQDRGAKIQFNGMMSDKLPTNGDLPPWVKRQDKGPTIEQLYEMLAGGAGVVMGMNHLLDGHIVTLAGMDWKDNNGNGIVDPREATLSIIDPLDPSSNVDNGNQDEPYGSDRLTPQRAMFTELHVWQDEYQGDPFLAIEYKQYMGSQQTSGGHYGPYEPENNYHSTNNPKPYYLTIAYGMRAVPEPTSVLVWSTLVLGFTLTRRRRSA